MWALQGLLRGMLGVETLAHIGLVLGPVCL